ncbi:MAG: LD-carboxypeptidase [Ruminococcus sp.]|nr:LD-carboxypeptidase [Ruminococcus sp.]
MLKPRRLRPGDTIATISPSWGCAGTNRVKWKYELGVRRLRELGLDVVAAPNSMKGTSYLDKHPQARAEDLMWAFENQNVRAIIANIGGNDSERLLPFLDPQVILRNPKILCGYSDVLALHLYCHRLGLSTFYGDNLLTVVAEAGGWHPYSRYWFQKVFFDSSPIGEIPPSPDWSYTPNNHTNPEHRKVYIPSDGYVRIQGSGRACGRLFGGHGCLNEYEHPGIVPVKSDFQNAIFFYEDIPKVCTADYIGCFFDWLGQNGFLQVLRGIIIGKLPSPKDFTSYIEKIREVVSGRYGLSDLPILCGLHFGHSSPICILPFGAPAVLNMDNLTFSISDSGVLA